MQLKMKKKFVYFVILFLAIILQTSALPLILPGKAVGDVVLMLVLAGVVLDGFFGFFWWAIFFGIFYDLAVYQIIGTSSLTFLLLVYFVSFFSRRFSVELKGLGLLFFVGFVVVASIISHIIATLPLVLHEKGFSVLLQSFGSLKIFSLEIFYNLLLFLVCFIILRKAKNFFTID
ncbi:MAG: hypothetical protein US25_C0059G0001 [Candidatus Moranbacteria bacterium GW2011_GWE1_36_7]|nr:MAG: hypothetical protein US25_C0059G0001 [Candidatus Moranbacteria bacterium GW2011_GWE1_36_7]